MKVDVLLGLQWGDEGKGKIVDVLAPQYDIIARFQGGPNAGHTLIFNNSKHILHTIPSGIFRKNNINIIGNGVVIDPIILEKEILDAEKNGADLKNNLLISNKASLIMPTHKILDNVYEETKANNKIGTTGKGIGPAYSDQVARLGLKIGDICRSDFLEKYNIIKKHHLKILQSYNFDFNKLNQADEKLWFEALKFLQNYKFINSEHFINDALINNKKVLAEGAQGTMLDINFGTYPFVTSSNTISAGVCTGLGIAPQKIGEVLGITKAYCTRVGAGPFPTKQNNDIGKLLQNEGKEFGSTTGRPRDCGWLDLVALKYAIMLNGVTQLFITKIDVLNKLDVIKIGVAYNINGKITQEFPENLEHNAIDVIYENFTGWKCDLSNCKSIADFPLELKKYLKFIENQLSVPIKYLSIGANREETICID